MKVRLSSELFVSPLGLSLLRLFEYGLEEQHRIEVDPEDPAFVAWLELQAPDVREQCQLAVNAEILEDAQRPSKSAIVVTSDDESDWSEDPPRVCIRDARLLLGRPFEIWLEDDTSDKAFLRKMLTQEERRLFDELEQREQVRVVHGGGSKLKDGIKRRATLIGAKLQTWVLFDSDALQPGAPSKDSNAVRDECEGAGLLYHQLERRFIESYLPLNALEKWGKAHSYARGQNLPIVRAFRRMSDSQRHHYNMKHGFARDELRRTNTGAHEAGALYDGLDPKDQQRLDQGFGEKIGELFQDRYPNSSEERHRVEFVDEHDLRRDGGWDEMRPQIRKLFDLMGAPT